MPRKTPRTPRSARPPAGPPSTHYDRCMPFPAMFGQLLRMLRERAGIWAFPFAESAGLDIEQLLDFEAGVTLPNPDQLEAITLALGTTRDEFDAEAHRIVAFLEARGTWVFLHHPWERPAHRRLRSRSVEHATWAVRPMLVSGVWLREEVQAEFYGSPPPARTTLEQARGYAREHLGLPPPDGPEDAPISGPSQADVAAALQQATERELPDDCKSWHRGDGTEIGEALTLTTLMLRGEWAPVVSSLVWFDHQRSPRVIGERRDQTLEPLPPVDHAIAFAAQIEDEDTPLRRGPDHPARDRLVDHCARLVVAFRRDMDDPA
jgi:hypothetical protein